MNVTAPSHPTLLVDVDPKELLPGNNIRTDLGDLSEMVTSMLAYGVIQPLIVRVVTDETGTDQYEIVAGHRRHQAALLAGLKTVPVIVQVRTTDEVDEAMLVENLMRLDLSPVEEARGYFRLVERGMDAKTLAARIGRSIPHITGRLALLELHDDDLALVDKGDVTLNAAEHLLRAQTAGVRTTLLATLRAKASKGGNLSYETDQAIAHEKTLRVADKIVAKAEKSKHKIFVKANYQDDVPDGLTWVTSSAPYGRKGLGLSDDDHKNEPCNVIYIDLTRGRKPEPTMLCDDPDRHAPKGASLVKMPKRTVNAKTDAEKARDAEVKAQIAAAQLRRLTTVSAVTAAELNKWLLSLVLADIDTEDAKVAVATLDLEPVRVPTYGEEKKDGTPRTQPDFPATLRAEAAVSATAARRVAAALVLARQQSYRLSGPWKSRLVDQVAEVQARIFNEPLIPQDTLPEPTDDGVVDAEVVDGDA